jgi:oxalate decarboxylase/phosphoglucose isomerase-like protein (cupin superfamily)
MKQYNIYNNNESGLGTFTDDRGTITDIFYKAGMNHACLITNTAGAVRGNHYHKHTTQYTYVLTGSMVYYSKPVDSDGTPTEFLARKGDFIISPPNEIHAMKTTVDGCTFIAFAEGPRGGEDYETDTYRVDSIIPGDDK